MLNNTQTILICYFPQLKYQVHERGTHGGDQMTYKYDDSKNVQIRWPKWRTNDDILTLLAKTRLVLT